MPLGLLPGIAYEEKASSAGATRPALLRRDRRGARPGREMYGFPRLREAMATELAGTELLDELLDELHAFTGRGWEQEDDITWSPSAGRPGGDGDWSMPARGRATRDAAGAAERPRAWPFSSRAPSATSGSRWSGWPTAVAPLGLEPARLERLKTAVSETAMNAIEYGSQGDPDVPVGVRVDATPTTLRVRIADRARPAPCPRPRCPTSTPSSPASRSRAAGACS